MSRVKGGQKRKDSTLLFFNVAKWLLFAIVVCLCFLNIRPYVRFSEILWGNIIASNVDSYWMSQPSIAFANSFVILIIGILIWAILQLLQTLPILVAHSRKVLSSLLEKAAEASNVSIEDSDNDSMRWLKEKLNNLETLPVYQLRRMRLIAYGVDLGICVIVFNPTLLPPDFWAIGMVVVTIWTVEFIVEAFFMLRDLTDKIAVK